MSHHYCPEKQYRNNTQHLLEPMMRHSLLKRVAQVNNITDHKTCSDLGKISTGSSGEC